MTFILLFLTHFILYNRFWVHPLHQNWLKFIPFCGWVIFLCIYVTHLFIHSSVDGHLGCFHVLALSIGVHMSFWIMVFSGYMAPHSSTLAWKIPWTEEPDRLQSMGLHRVGHDWATSLSLFTFMLWRRKWQPTPVFLPGDSHGWRSLVGCSPWGC